MAAVAGNKSNASKVYKAIEQALNDVGCPGGTPRVSSKAVCYHYLALQREVIEMLEAKKKAGDARRAPAGAAAAGTGTPALQVLPPTPRDASALETPAEGKYPPPLWRLLAARAADGLFSLPAAPGKHPVGPQVAASGTPRRRCPLMRRSPPARPRGVLASGSFVVMSHQRTGPSMGTACPCLCPTPAALPPALANAIRAAPRARTEAIFNKNRAAPMSSFLSMPGKSPRLLLVTDLDHTLVGKASSAWEWQGVARIQSLAAGHGDDPGDTMLQRFNSLWEGNFAHDSLLVYSTGRSLKLFRQGVPPLLFLIRPLAEEPYLPQGALRTSSFPAEPGPAHLLGGDRDVRM